MENAENLRQEPYEIFKKAKEDVTCFLNVGEYVESGQPCYLYRAIGEFTVKRGWDLQTAMIEVSKHYEEGAKKYGEYNWQKGIPTHCYIDSAVRHYFKYLRGDTDERHDRAFVWNLLCCIWTCNNMPELNDYKKN